MPTGRVAWRGVMRFSERSKTEQPGSHVSMMTKHCGEYGGTSKRDKARGAILILVLHFLDIFSVQKSYSYLVKNEDFNAIVLEECCREPKSQGITTFKRRG